MWKKNDPRPYTSQPSTQPPAAAPASPPEPRKFVSTIGPSISITGDLSGDEDLEIQGRVEGSLTLNKHNVTVGKNGHVKADIHAKSIRVAGEVKGNLFGEDEVVIQQSGRVNGNITAAQVTLENGSKFKGSIDMEPKDDDKQRSGLEKDSLTKTGKSHENGRFGTQSQLSGSTVRPA